MSTSHVQEHVDLIARHEQEFLEARTGSERVGDRIAASVGSFAFVGVQVVLCLLWAGWNTLSRFSHFDPFPFSLLGTVLALEALILASFILMRQARMSRRGDERDHLMLQVLLLTEKEITAVLNMDRQIAEQVGLQRAANTPEVRTLSQQTSIEDVAQTIRENLPTVE